MRRSEHREVTPAPRKLLDSAVQTKTINVIIFGVNRIRVQGRPFWSGMLTLPKEGGGSTNGIREKQTLSLREVRRKACLYMRLEGDWEMQCVQGQAQSLPLSSLICRAKSD